MAEPKNSAHKWQTTTTGLRQKCTSHILLTNSNFLQKTFAVRRNQLSAETIMQLITYAANTKRLVHPRVYENFMFDNILLTFKVSKNNLNIPPRRS
jgi:hypothetical protein